MTEDEKDELDLLSSSQEFVYGLYEAMRELKGKERAAKAIRSLIEKGFIELCWAEDLSDQNYRLLTPDETTRVLRELDDEQYWNTDNLENGYYAFDITDAGSEFYRTDDRAGRYYREEWLQRHNVKL